MTTDSPPNYRESSFPLKPWVPACANCLYLRRAGNRPVCARHMLYVISFRVCDSWEECWDLGRVNELEDAGGTRIHEAPTTEFQGEVRRPFCRCGSAEA